MVKTKIIFLIKIFTFAFLYNFDPQHKILCKQLEVCFKNEDLFLLFSSGASKCYKIPESVIEKFVLRLFQLEAAYTFEDISLSKSMNFREKENSTKEYLIDLAESYTLIIEIDWLSKGKTQGRILIIEIEYTKGN